MKVTTGNRTAINILHLNSRSNTHKSSNTMATDPSNNLSILVNYLSLDQPKDKIQVTYVWVDGSGETLRCKTRTVDKVPSSPDDLPVWMFAGIGTGQGTMEDTDQFLKPVRLYKDPFLGNDNKLVLCEVLDSSKKPHETNKRHSCVQVMNKTSQEFDSWFGIEQEYILINTTASRPNSYHPLGWPSNGFPEAQQHMMPSYLAVGANKIVGRHVVEAHYRACLFAGVNITGTNAEAILGQWEYQVGPNDGCRVSDDLWMSRYILVRVAEDFGIGVTFDPKPVPGNWNGSGCHTNVSTIQSRTPGKGLQWIKDSMEKLKKRHKEHVQVYDPRQGRDNERRSTGACFAPKLDQFSWEVGNRFGSVRIPKEVADDGQGYFEDRRPAANCDPYSVTEIIVRTICLNE